MDYILEIKLKSPLTSGAGIGRVGIVDQDITYDDLGLPILPGRRIKGLWREAYHNVADAWRLCGKSTTSVDEIFGKLGQKSDEGETCLYVGNAELQEASLLKPWLMYFQHRDKRTKEQKLHPDNVVQHFATVRAQTAIDRGTGSAREDTLRLTRTLQANLVFRAPVQFSANPDKELLNALVLGASALQHMGTARTRGLGKVCCRLIARDVNGQETDLTEQILKQDLLPSITVGRSVRPLKHKICTVPRVSFTIPTHVLLYRLTLRSSVVIRVADGDPNTVVSRQDVPGSHILGAAAWSYLRQTGHTPADKEFRHAFLDGGLRFLTAYPETVNTQQRMLPIPHSIRQFKETECLLDFAAEPPEGEPTKRLDRNYTRMNQGRLETQTVKTERNYHHARAAKDRRIGRALGAEVPDGGAFFKYEALQAGQTFQGAVLGSEQDLVNLQIWLKGTDSIRIGRSRSAQYGEAAFKWIDNAPRPLESLAECDGFVVPQTPPDPGNCLTITTLSPLLTVNDNGHPEARFPEIELAKILGVSTSKLELSCSYTRTELIGGYHSHLCLHQQQWPAIAAGSVFVFDTEAIQDSLTENRLWQLEHDGLGLRRGEGYGRVAVNRLELRSQMESQLDGLENQIKPPVPGSNGSEIPEQIRGLLQNIIRMRCLTEIQELAIIIAGRAENVPSNSLLGRLRLFLQEEPIVAVDRLNSLRRPAKEGLTNCQVNRGPGMPWMPHRMTLYEFFRKTWTEPEFFVETLVNRYVQELVEEEVNDHYSGTSETLRNALMESSEEICKAFLNHLVSALYRKSRT